MRIQKTLARSEVLHRAINELKLGRPVVVLDEKNRENEGDLVMAAEFATPRWVNFMIRECRGLVCVPMERERLASLGIREMVERNEDPHCTRFAVSVDAVGCTTGISAYERSMTIRTLASPLARKEDFRKPGHVFPLIANPLGLKGRRGHTEASLELMKLAGLSPAAVICEILKDNGEMARKEDLKEFCHLHGFEFIEISDITEFLGE